MIDSGMGMDGNWDWKVYLGRRQRRNLQDMHALWVFISFVSQRLNMFLITQYLVIRMEVIFVLHFLSFCFSFLE
jgi:hypothetical protein